MAPSKTKTRGKASAKAAQDPPISTTLGVTLAPQCSNPPKVFILPKDTTSEARVVSLAHPRTTLPMRYLVCPEKGFYEFTKVGAPQTTPRSLLLAPEGGKPENETIQISRRSEKKDEMGTGYITKAADIFIATPIDPLFLLLPVLAPTPLRSSSPKQRMFLEADEYLDNLSASSPHFRSLLHNEKIRQLLESRMEVVCDGIEAGEMMYRLSEQKLLSEILRKASSIVAAGLPASMEEKLIRKALEVPMLSLKRGESSKHDLLDEEESRTATPVADRTDSQSTAASTERAPSFASTAATEVSEIEDSKPKAGAVPATIVAPEGVPHLLRLRTALNFIMSSYVPKHLAAVLKASLASPLSPHNFCTLDSHLSHLGDLTKQALAARSIGDYSRKRSMNEDDEAGEGKVEKKRKLEEEEKRKKAGESRGVRDLKKADVSGMKKMSDFFKKKA